MSRYFTRPKGYGKSHEPRAFECEDTWHTDPVLPNLDVPDHEASYTGLIDHNGDPIMRGPNPMGFLADL